MLAQILRDMYVDPEILAELPEEQKQILFVKMREEQVRRWHVREDELEKKELKNSPQRCPKKASEKTVHYLIAADGNPWVWVLGEDEEDEKKDIGELLRNEELKAEAEDERRAKELAHKEIEEMKKKELERLEEERQWKEEQERLTREAAARNAEKKRLEEEARLAAQKAEEERNRLEELRKQEEKKRQELERKKQEEERRAKEEERRRKDAEEEQRRLEEEKRRAEVEIARQKIEEERKAREKAMEEARRKRLEKEARERARQLEEEKRRVEEQQKEAERKQREVLARLQQRKAEKERRERELVENETKRAQEIFMSLKRVREEQKKKEEDEKRKEDEAWEKQEQKAREEECRRRNSVSLARKEVWRERQEAKRLSMMEGVGERGTLPFKGIAVKPQRPPPPVPTRPSNIKSRPDTPQQTQPLETTPVKPGRSVKPSNRKAVVEWFQQEELSKRICYVGDKILPYFHGIISRQDAENLLVREKPGTFLVRVSERVWGYTITYRAQDRCKHYLIDTSENTYQFFGHNQIAHGSLNDLVEFHKVRPISGVGQELLLFPCGQKTDPPDYEDLLKTDQHVESFSTKL